MTVSGTRHVVTRVGNRTEIRTTTQKQVTPGRPLPTPPRVYVQPTNPGLVGVPFVWIQTGLGQNGKDWTVWFDDGSGA